MSTEERAAAANVHRAARAIARALDGTVETWRDYVLAAQIAVFGYDHVDAEASERARAEA